MLTLASPGRSDVSCRTARVVIAWHGLPGYARTSIGAAIRAFPGVRFDLITSRSDDHQKYRDVDQVGGVPVRHVRDQDPLTWAGVGVEPPDLFLFTSWAHRGYRRLADATRAGGGRAISMIDTIHARRPRQWLGALWFRARMRPRIDGVWVPGMRGRAFARFLGMPDERIHLGLYGADPGIFSDELHRVAEERRDRILFVGQFIERKGVRALLDVAGIDPRFRKRLLMIGAGPMADEIRDAGVECHDFMEPRELAENYRRASIVFLPSQLDHWGVVLHEGAMAGCLLAATRACGAASDLIEHGRNGYVMGSSSAAEVAGAVAWESGLPVCRRIRARDRSRELGSRFGHDAFCRALRAMLDPGSRSAGDAEAWKQIRAGAGSDRARVSVVGPIRGSATGGVVATRAIISRMEERLSVTELNTLRARDNGLIAALARLDGYARACLRILATCVSGRRCGYFVAMNSGNAILLDALAVALMRVSGARTVLHHHTVNYLARRSRRMALLIAVAGKKAVHVVPSTVFETGLRSVYDPVGRCIVLPLALEEPLPDIASDGDDPAEKRPLVVGFLSNLMPGKGVEAFLRLVCIAGARDLDLRFVMAGRTIDHAVERTVRSTAAAHPGRITFLGPVFGAQKTAFFREIDVFCFLSRQESWAIVVTEAMREGRPVVMFENRFVRAQFDEGNVVEIEGTGPEAIERLVAILAEASRDRASLPAGRLRLRNNYARLWSEFNTSVDAILDVLDEGGRRPGAAS